MEPEPCEILDPPGHREPRHPQIPSQRSQRWIALPLAVHIGRQGAQCLPVTIGDRGQDPGGSGRDVELDEQLGVLLHSEIRLLNEQDQQDGDLEQQVDHQKRGEPLHLDRPPVQIAALQHAPPNSMVDVAFFHGNIIKASD